MKIYLILPIILLSVSGYAQKIDSAAKADLKGLSDKFIPIKKDYDKQLNDLKVKKDELGINTTDLAFNDLQKQIHNAKVTKIRLDSVYKIAENYKAFYGNKGIKTDSLNKYFPHQIEIDSEVGLTLKKNDSKTYFYFGEKMVIQENDSIFNNKTVNSIFMNTLSRDSKTYLGDFIIPQKDQQIKVYHGNNHAETDEIVKFKEIKIHLREGAIDDLKIMVLDEDNNEMLFENRTPISILQYTSIAPKNYIFFKTAISKNKNIPLINNYFQDHNINLADVINYIPNPGENYVPEDLVLNFPTDSGGKPLNLNNAVKYKIEQNNALQNVVELRTYTDFLGLFGDTPNGIVQLEGKADFYISPFNIPNTSIYLFKKVTPYVNFSKLDQKTRNIALQESTPSSFTFKTPLDILQKSYLQMGFNLSLFSFKFKKEFPFEINFYGATQYQITDVMKTDSIGQNYKTMGLGGGINLEFKRYNNFGFIYSSQFTRYNVNGFNTLSGVLNAGNFWVFKNEAEIYYYPGTTKQQSIFLRLKTFNDITKSNNDAFYQLQLGYSFSIGGGKVTR
jgi:hypothetical protein